MQNSTEIGRLQERAGELGTELGTKASLHALRECVTRRHYEQAVSALGAAVEHKAAQVSLDSVQSKLQVKYNCNYLLIDFLLNFCTVM